MDRHNRIASAIKEKAGQQWRDKLSSICDRLDEQEVSVPDPWPAKDHSTWRSMANADGGAKNVVNAFRYALSKLPEDFLNSQ